MTALTQIEISREVGICVDRFTGTSSFNFFLIDAQPGHPARTERCVLSCLEQLHGMHSIDHVFIDFDGSGKSGSFEREIDVAPYRAFPNQSITKGITQSIVDQDLLSGGMAFAIICDPPARLEALDDMYCRTMQREFLNELNAEVGKIALASQVARALIRNDEDVDRLLSLVRLEMTHAEWAEDRDRLATIDPVEVLSPLRSAMQDSDRKSVV